MKRIIITLFLFVSVFAIGQKEQDSSMYYRRYSDSVKAASRNLLDKLSYAARQKHGGDGYLVICVDSLYKPIRGMKVELLKTYKSDKPSDSITTTITDSNGVCLFRRRVGNYSVNMRNVNNIPLYFELCSFAGRDEYSKNFAFHIVTNSENKRRRKRITYIERKYAEDGSHLHDTSWNHLKDFVLIDKLTGNKFILDSTQTIITAVDSTGKVLWRTNPRKDADLDTYRITHPFIYFFRFSSNEWTDYKRAIWITYDNSQFGTIDLKTGVFSFMGQD